LLRAHLLHVESENACPLREVVDVSTDPQELQHIAGFHGSVLFSSEAEASAVGVFILSKRFPICSLVEGKTHLVQRVSLQRESSIEDVGSRYRVVFRNAHARINALVVPCLWAWIFRRF
jgi:hypothetical protein